MNTIDIMLDLETLGTTPGSVVLAIGAVASSSPELDHQIYRKLNVMEQLYLGLTVDPDTMSWWRKQDKEAWLSSVGCATDLRTTLEDLATWISAVRRGPLDQPTGSKIRIWGDAVSFDCGLLASVFRAAKVIVPWDYREEFCYRTVRTLANSEKPRAKLQHNALDDARAQLVHLQELLAPPSYVIPAGTKFTPEQIRELQNSPGQFLVTEEGRPRPVGVGSDGQL